MLLSGAGYSASDHESSLRYFALGLPTVPVIRREQCPTAAKEVEGTKLRRADGFSDLLSEGLILHIAGQLPQDSFLLHRKAWCRFSHRWGLAGVSTSLRLKVVTVSPRLYIFLGSKSPDNKNHYSSLILDRYGIKLAGE